MKDFIGQSLVFQFTHAILRNLMSPSLIHDQSVRPAPKEMLGHPWVVKAMKEDVHMAKWVRQVWKGKKTKERYVCYTTSAMMRLLNLASNN